MCEHPVKILIVDDEYLVRWSLKRFMESEGFDAYEVEGGHKALEILAKYPISILITDLMMPEMDGVELIKIAIDKTPDLGVLVITASDSTRLVDLAQNAGAKKVFIKPVSFKELAGAVNSLL